MATHIGACALAAALFATIAGNAAAQPLLPPRTFASGGIGSDAREDMKAIASLYNLHLAFAQASTGAYIAGVAVSIRRAGSNRTEPVCTDCGPWVYVALAPGSYTVFATWEGVTQTRTVRVERKPTRAVLYWPGQEPDARLPAGVPM